MDATNMQPDAGLIVKWPSEGAKDKRMLQKRREMKGRELKGLNEEEGGGSHARRVQSPLPHSTV